MQELTLNILGFAAVNRDLTVELNDPATGTLVKQGKPFLDGTLKFPKVDAGAYEVVLRHPNIALPVLTRPIQSLATGSDADLAGARSDEVPQYPDRGHS